VSEDQWLAAALAGLPADARVRLGPGDDAAILHAPDGDIAVAKDVLIDGVHFELTSCGGAAAAHKALAVNLSDLAAMAAQPLGFLVGVVLPQPAEASLFAEVMTGFREAARAFDCPLLGGDTNAARGPLVLSVTVLGRAGPLGFATRAGALAGDALSVTGPLGGSGAGRHLSPQPRLAAGMLLQTQGIAHALMDLSDGLSRDLPRLCAASGVGALLAAESIPIHADAAGDLDRALHEGEDFELLVAHGALAAAQRDALASAGIALDTIGRFQVGSGVVLAQAGVQEPLAARGYDHLGG
jgi:thiamine-monophosphate kinase